MPVKIFYPTKWGEILFQKVDFYFISQFCVSRLNFRVGGIFKNKRVLIPKLKMLEVEFNPDGSIKLPEIMVKKKEDDDKIFQDEPSIRIIRNQISTVTPLTCELQIQASDKLKNFDRVESIYKQATGKFRHMANLSIRKTNNREYTVKIISGRYRCSWCENFRKFIEKEMNVKVINWGSCFDYASSRKY